MLGRNKYVAVFVDFKKAYDSIDRKTLMGVLEEFGVDKKTRNLISQTISNTHSKIKFMGEISESFEIKTGVRQGDGLSPILFNCVLEKVIREWKKGISDKEAFRIGRGNGRIRIDCLAFADDIVILTDDISKAKKRVDELQMIAKTTGLQVSYEKTEFMTNIKGAPHHLELGEEKIKRVKSFKYLGERIQENGSEKDAIKDRARRMEMAYQLTKTTYNKKVLSYGAKLRHLDTVIKPECLYAAETLDMTGKAGLEDIRKRERKMLRKILGPKVKDEVRRLRPNKELYHKTEGVVELMKKRRIQFYGHLMRMDRNRLTKRIFEFFRKRKTEPKWFREVRTDLTKMGLKEEDILDRDRFRRLVKEFGGFQETEVQVKKKRSYTVEQKKEVSERMKRYWQKVKAEKAKCNVKTVKRGP